MIEHLLAIETSGDVCSVALLENGKLRVETIFRHGMHLSERLISIISTLLTEAGITLSQIDAFAVGIGPGSFTGIRIGVMTAKTLADTLAKPLFGIVDMEAIAETYRGISNTNVVVILPCRADILLFAIYDVTGVSLNEIIPPRTEPVQQIVEEVAKLDINHIILSGPGISKSGEALKQLLEANGCRVSLGTGDLPRASSIGQLAYKKAIKGAKTDDPISLVPLYIAPPPISVSKTPIPQ